MNLAPGLPLAARLRRLSQHCRAQVAAASALAGTSLAASVYLFNAGASVLGNTATFEFLPQFALALLVAGLGYAAAQLLQLGAFRRSYRDATLLMQRSALPLQVADYTHLACMFDLLCDGDAASAVPQLRPHSLEEQILAAASLMGVFARGASASEDSIRRQLRSALRTLRFVRSGLLCRLAVVIVCSSLHPVCWLNPLFFLSLRAWQRRSAVLGASAAICDQFVFQLEADQDSTLASLHLCSLLREKIARSM